MPTSHQISMATPHNKDELLWFLLAIKASRLENPNHRFLGLIGLPTRENRTSSSTTSSSTTSSFTTLPLPPLLPLPPYIPLSPLLSYYYYSGRGYSESCGRDCGEDYGGGCNKGFSKANDSSLSRPGVGDIIAFFLTKLLSLFIFSKIPNSI